MNASPTPNSPVEPRFVGREEAAKFCGISTRTFDRCSRKESFPRRRMIGRNPKWFLPELKEWMDNNES